jgi:5-methylcytosine-specific restriction endonuclease McrA
VGHLETFYSTQPHIEDYWRAVILFGRNVATYKFALGKSLLELADAGSESVTLEELAEPFSRHLCAHLSEVDRQGTSPQSRFLETCRAFNRGEVASEALVTSTARLGFVNVIDAFHELAGGPIPVRFFIDERQGGGGIRLTDELSTLRQALQYRNLGHEVEARWRLVETAWELNMPRNALAVSYEETDELLVVRTRANDRRAVTGCREALSGYQKGACFYCGSAISLDQRGAAGVHVDHFMPHALGTRGTGRFNLNGVWNLVLACPRCNLDKSARVPALPFLERLHARNEYLIASHHPLRETLMLQTGLSEADRRRYLQHAHAQATIHLVHQWQPEVEEEIVL